MRFRPTSKTGLVTHRGCLDGTGSALMFVMAGGHRDNILFSGPNKCELSAAQAEHFDEVWFADVCPKDLTDPAGGKPFRVFDHHVSNMKHHAGNENCVFDMERSGTSLMAQQLGLMDHLGDGDETFSLLITALEAYDLGRFDDRHGMRLADVAATYSQGEMLDLMLEKDPEGVLFDRDWTHRADAMAAVRRLYAVSASKSAVSVELWSPSDNRDVRALMAASPVYWKNDVATELLTRSCELAVIFDVSSNMVSLRSRKDGPDCSMIATGYGGGGHARAAGFSTKFGTLLEAMEANVFG